MRDLLALLLTNLRIRWRERRDRRRLEGEWLIAHVKAWEERQAAMNGSSRDPQPTRMVG